MTLFLAAAPTVAAVAPSVHPSWFDIPLSAVTVALVLLHPIFFLLAFISIMGSHQRGGMKLVWIVFAFCAPFLGPLLWFLVGRNNARDRVDLT